MGRTPVPRGKKATGSIGFMPPDGVFLAARDLMYLVPLRVRILEVLVYPKGTTIGGHPCREPFNALRLEAHNSKGEWVTTKKPLRLNVTNQIKLFSRFGHKVAWWEGQEFTIDLGVTRDPSGGRKSGAKLVYGIIVAPEPEEMDEEAVKVKMHRAIRGECPYLEEQVDTDRDIKPGNETTTEDDHADADLGG